MTTDANDLGLSETLLLISVRTASAQAFTLQLGCPWARVACRLAPMLASAACFDCLLLSFASVLLSLASLARLKLSIAVLRRTRKTP